LIDAILRDLRFGIRMLLKNTGFTSIAVITLALGIGANTAIFSVISAVLLRPLAYEDPDRLVWLFESKTEVQNRWVSYLNFQDWRARNQVFESMSTIRGMRVTLTGSEEAESLEAQLVSADYFSIFRVNPLLGRAFSRDEDLPGTAPVTILSYQFWQERFGGDPQIIGQAISLDSKSATVVGIMPQSFEHRGPPPLWLLTSQKLSEYAKTHREERAAGYVIARIKPGITLETARTNMSAISDELNRQYPRHNSNHKINVVSLHESIIGRVSLALTFIAGAVGLILLIACVNVANLLLARASILHKEMAIRTALGARRLQVFRQFLIESVLLSLLGGIFGLLITYWGLKLLELLAASSLPRIDGIGIDYQVLLFTLGLSLLTGMVFGAAPAWRVTKVDIHKALKNVSRTAGEAHHRILQSGLIVTEVALSFILLSGAGLLIRSFSTLLESNPGFDPKRVLTFELSLQRPRYAKREEINRFHLDLLARLKAIPGVESASVLNELPGRESSWQNDILPQGHRRLNPGEEINVDWGIISPDYFKTLRIPIKQGRDFTSQEVASGASVLIVDEQLARKFWPNGDALGKYIYYNGPVGHEIIGIAGNVRTYDNEALSRIKIYTPLGLSWLWNAVVAIQITTDDLPGITAAIKREVQIMDKTVPIYEIATLSDRLAKQVAPRRFIMIILGIFAAVAMALAAIGIYGVTAHTVSQRRNEIGLRMALGAQVRNVRNLVLRQGMIPVLIGIVVGLIGAWFLTRLMSGLLFGISATDTMTFAAVSTLLICVAFFACYLPARGAMKVDPLVALKYE
jgi:putative ABC transport system permease protein